MASPRLGARRKDSVRKRTGALVLGLATCVGPGTALANGRFPGATQLVKRGDDGLVTTSFGVVTTTTGFSRTEWQCEEALGYDPQANNDLGAAIFPNGAVVLAGPLGLSVSTDGGCTHRFAAGDLGTQWLSDVTVDEASPTTGLALVRGARTGDCAGALFETLDQAASWTALGTKLPAGFCALTVDSAPSDRNRIYVSGNVLGPDGSRLVARVLVSRDRGIQWEEFDLPGEARPFIGAMHPLDADTLYLRTLAPPSGGSLFVTHDGARTFREVAKLTGIPLQFFGVTGLAVSPDGNSVVYGSVNEGLWRIDGQDGAPKKIGDLPITCLTWATDGLYACSAPNLCGPFFVGRSLDSGQSFLTVTPTFDIDGDRTQCEPSSPTATRCPAAWPAIEARLGACAGDAGAVPSETKDDAGPGSSAPPPELSCGCTSVGGGRRIAWPWLTGLALGAVALRARIRRRRG